MFQKQDWAIRWDGMNGGMKEIGFIYCPTNQPPGQLASPASESAAVES